jgi:hypothetical protein
MVLWHKISIFLAQYLTSSKPFLRRGKSGPNLTFINCHSLRTTSWISMLYWVTDSIARFSTLKYLFRKTLRLTAWDIFIIKFSILQNVHWQSFKKIDVCCQWLRKNQFFRTNTIVCHVIILYNNKAIFSVERFFHENHIRVRKWDSFCLVFTLLQYKFTFFSGINITAGTVFALL